MRKWKYGAPSFLTSTLEGGERPPSHYGPCTATDRTACTRCIEYLKPLGTLEKRKIFCLCRESNHNSSAIHLVAWSLCQIHYPRSLCRSVCYVSFAEIHHASQLVHVYRVSQEECARLREGVPYAKVYRYNPKYLCPKLTGYGDNGQIKVWSSCWSTHCTCQLTILSMPALECGVI